MHLQCEIGAAEAEEIGESSVLCGSRDIYYAKAVLKLGVWAGACRAALQLSACAGVEHLLRDVKDVNITSLSQQVTEKIFSLRALQLRLVEAHE